jgi:hypothetical protein
MEQPLLQVLLVTDFTVITVRFKTMISQSVSNELAAVLAPPQLKLCPYDEEKPAIWSCLIKDQFAALGIKSKKVQNGMLLLIC